MSRLLAKPILAATFVFFLSWLIYAQMIPFVMHTWKITGDEPHYLLAAHSLAYDGDLDLKNNYLDGDHKYFYPLGFLDPHIKEQPGGAWLLSHDIGLPILIAPAYALGGRLGVMHFFALLGGCLAAQMYLLGWEASGKWWAGLLGGLSLAFSAPLSLYVFQVYPEMIGGLLCLFAARHILNTPEWLNSSSGRSPTSPDAGRSQARSALLRGDKTSDSTTSYWLPAPLHVGAVAALPWLSGRYIPIQIFLIALTVWKHWPDRPRWITLTSIALASLALYLGLNFYFFGGPTPSTTGAGNAVAAGFSDVPFQQVGRGLAAWLFDQQRGLLIYGPVLIIAFFGIPHLWNLRRLEGVLLLAPLTLMWALVAVWGGFYIGWEFSARFLVVGVPLMAGAVAAIAGRVRNIFFWPIAAGLVTLSILNTIIVVLDPFYALHESPVKFYEEATKWQIRQCLPALGTRYIETPPDGAGEWTAAKGEPKYLLQATVDELSIGWYNIQAQAQFADAADGKTPALIFDVYSSESGIPLAHADVRPAEVDPATRTVNISIPFYNPYFDKWNFPLYVDVRSTGVASARLSWLLFEPNPAEIYKPVLVWGALILGLTVWFADERFVRTLASRLWRR